MSAAIVMVEVWEAATCAAWEAVKCAAAPAAMDVGWMVAAMNVAALTERHAVPLAVTSAVAPAVFDAVLFADSIGPLRRSCPVLTAGSTPKKTTLQISLPRHDFSFHPPGSERSFSVLT
jgi:hypothetical protein